MTTTRPTADDDFRADFVRLLTKEGQRAGVELEPGAVEVFFDHAGDLVRATVVVSTDELEILAADDQEGGLVGAADEVVAVLRDLRPEENYVVMTADGFAPSTRRELPPVRGEAETSDELDDLGDEDAFWSSYPPEDPRYGEPGSVFGHRPGGETDRLALVVSMSPVVDRAAYVFCEVDEVPDGVAPVVRIDEDRRTTVCVTQELADARGWSYALPLAMISMPVDCTPGEVDLTADIAGTLTAEGIGCRVVAGLRRDRVFVPFDRGWDVLSALEVLRDAVTAGARRPEA